MDKHVSRRRFLKQSALAGAAPCFVSSAVGLGAAEPVVPPGERVNLGFIGVGPRAGGLFNDFLPLNDVRVPAVCDVDKRHLGSAAKRIGGKVDTFHDHRKLLERKDLDAVVVVTPPHWHAIHAVDVCRAGFDLYIEKPLTITLEESKAICRAARENKTISQVGTQIHANDNYIRVVEIVRSGVLGQINVVRTFLKLDQTSKGIGNVPDTDPPPELDWNRWVGPAPMQPYNPLMTKGSFHHCSFMQFSGGWMPGMAPHIIDLPVWALELGLPTQVSCSGGRFVIKDRGNQPDVQEALIQYPDLTMTWMMNLTNSYGWDFEGNGGRRRRLGVYFHGEKATLYANYSMHKIVVEDDPKAELPLPDKTLARPKSHQREWIDGIKTRAQPRCNVGYHHKVNAPICLANLSLALGRSLRFDPEEQKVLGDAEAQNRCTPDYRSPWKLG